MLRKDLGHTAAVGLEGEAAVGRDVVGLPLPLECQWPVKELGL